MSDVCGLTKPSLSFAFCLFLSACLIRADPCLPARTRPLLRCRATPGRGDQRARCLNAASLARAPKAQGAQGSPRQRTSAAGRVFLGYFLLPVQKKVTSCRAAPDTQPSRGAAAQTQPSPASLPRKYSPTSLPAGNLSKTRCNSTRASADCPWSASTRPSPICHCRLSGFSRRAWR